jgi:hypothetical protein
MAFLPSLTGRSRCTLTSYSLNEEESAGNSKSKAFSGNSGREKALPSTIRKSYGKMWWKSPLGRVGGSEEEERRGGGEK